MAERSKSAKMLWIIRGLTIITMLLAAVAAIRYVSLSGELRRGEELHRQGKYAEAISLLEPLSREPLAAIGLRAEAEKIMGFSKAELASRIALEKRSIAGYDEALLLLAEAQRLAGPSKDFQDRIDEYTEYRSKLQADQWKNPANEAPPPLPDDEWEKTAD